ncbi:MAG: protein-disulfide reductase DsbD domain-containing protein, partial [Gemmatimonadota bacterium]
MDLHALRFLLAAFLLGPGAALVAQPAAPASAPARAELLADAAAIAPGSTFTLGLRLRMAEGWHTYWQYSGDAGLSTRVEWRLPPGLQAGPLVWPGPHRYEEAGGLIAYGYADEVLLYAEVTASDTLTPGRSLHLAVAASWLACREICIPGDTLAALDLPLETRLRPSIDAALFDRYRQRAPQPLGEADPVAVAHETARRGRGADLEVRLEPLVGAFAAGSAPPDLYPLADSTFQVQEGPRQLLPSGGVIVRLGLSPYGDALPGQVSAVVSFPVPDRTEPAYRAVRLDLSAAAPAIDLLTADFAGSGGAGEPASLAVYLLMALAGGLILNLMPCVLPVISLKVLSFVSQAGEDPRRIRQLGAAFSAGIIATFLALAAAVAGLKAGGEQIGWGFQFQSPGFVVFLAALVFVLALSLFGVVTVRLPGAGGSFGSLGEGEGLAAS